MTKMQKRILKRVILRSRTNRLSPYEAFSKDGNDHFHSFLETWKEPSDFEESFQYLINRLNQKARLVLMMKYGQNMTFSEIAEYLGTAVSVVQHYERDAILTLSASPNKEILLHGLKAFRSSGEKHNISEETANILKENPDCDNLAQVFTKHRYTRPDNEHFAKVLEETLIRQGFRL